jgi:hypothetical protein
VAVVMPMLDMRLRAFLLALYMAWLGVYLRADDGRLTLRGRLTSTADAATTGLFYLDADELGVITINVGEVSYLGDYLAGTVGHRVVLVIGPEPR